MLNTYQEKQHHNPDHPSGLESGRRSNAKTTREKRLVLYKFSLATTLLVVISGLMAIAISLTGILALAAVIGISFLIYIVVVIKLYKGHKAHVPTHKPSLSSLSKGDRSSIPPPPNRPPPTLARCSFLGEDGTRGSIIQWVKIESFKLDLPVNNYSTLEDDSFSVSNSTHSK